MKTWEAEGTENDILERLKEHVPQLCEDLYAWNTEQERGLLPGSPFEKSCRPAPLWICPVPRAESFLAPVHTPPRATLLQGCNGPALVHQMGTTGSGHDRAPPILVKVSLGLSGHRTFSSASPASSSCLFQFNALVSLHLNPSLCFQRTPPATGSLKSSCFFYRITTKENKDKSYTYEIHCFRRKQQMNTDCSQ